LLRSLQHGRAINYAQLAQSVYRCGMDKKVRAVLDKRIDKIRGKCAGWDSLSIASTAMAIFCCL
jgi:hypothetical protein